MSGRRSRWLIGALALAALLAVASGCGGGGGDEASQPQARTEKIKGSDIVRVTLTADAARRLGVQTVKVRSDGGHVVIPYQAVLYDPGGETWTYTSPKPLVFQRVDITVEEIDGNAAVLAKGPPVGTSVVTVGATEIWGVEYGGIEED